MRTVLRTLVAVLGILGFGMPAMKCSADDGAIGVWKVDWKKSEPGIKEVPERYSSRYKTVKEFRDFVANRADGLVIEVRPDATALFRFPDRPASLTFYKGTVRYSWRKEQKGGLWMQYRPHILSASIGHGLKVSEPGSAILLYQVEWDEDVATRIPFILERQKGEPAGNAKEVSR